MILYQGNIDKSKQEQASKEYLGNDPYFERNYRRGRKSQ